MAAFYTINSKSHGPQEFEIRSSKGYGYVFLNGRQITESQEFTCNGFKAMLCYDSDLETTAKKWWKKFLEKQRKGD